MKEIEVLITFDDSKEEVLNKLSKFEFIKEKEIYDTYYVDELRDNLKPEKDLRTNEIFRVRRIDNDCLITFKKNHFDGKIWLYSDEYETKALNYEVVEKIIEMLGLQVQVIVNNKRKFYHYKDYEIVFEEVKDLGLFIEVEKVVSSDTENVLEIKEDIKKFIKSLNLKNVKELNVGKNQLMLAKKLGYTDMKIYLDNYI